MPAPVLTVEQVRAAVEGASSVRFLDKCGQKAVFAANINGCTYAVKFMAPVRQDFSEADVMDDVTARAMREISVMKKCRTTHLVKMGPIGLKRTRIDGQDFIFYTEEFIEGKNLKDHLQEEGALSVCQLKKLAFDVSEAIAELWSMSKVHRDVKPSNIMRRKGNDDFVLLDMGLVLDLEDESLSWCPVGTPIYSCPEQRDFQNRRIVMNFRSDLFSLGIVLYEMATKRHPFIVSQRQSPADVMNRISGSFMPVSPRQLRPDLPQKLDEAIMRLLAKQPFLRYRRMSMFHDDLRLV